MAEQLAKKTAKPIHYSSLKSRLAPNRERQPLKG